MRIVAEHLGRPKPGEQVSGDAAVVRTEGARTLLAMVDGLGHGPLAAAAAKDATDYLARVPLESSVTQVLNGLHQALKQGRGAVATLCLFDGKKLEAAGVGNVELRSMGTRVPLFARPGVLGKNLPQLTPLECQLKPGDRIVLFSDGLTARLQVEDVKSLSTAEACRELLERFSRSTDDATVLVADVEAT